MSNRCFSIWFWALWEWCLYFSYTLANFLACGSTLVVSCFTSTADLLSLSLIRRLTFLCLPRPCLFVVSPWPLTYFLCVSLIHWIISFVCVCVSRPWFVPLAYWFTACACTPSPCRMTSVNLCVSAWVCPSSFLFPGCTAVGLPPMCHAYFGCFPLPAGVLSVCAPLPLAVSRNRLTYYCLWVHVLLLLPQDFSFAGWLNSSVYATVLGFSLYRLNKPFG